jgi:hypothetical protein
MTRRFLDALFHGPPWRTFLVAGLFLGAFGLCSFNLAVLFMANFQLLAQYGAMGAWDGGVVQLIELVLWGYLSLAFYLLFKGCVDGLMKRLHGQ